MQALSKHSAIYGRTSLAWAVLCCENLVYECKQQSHKNIANISSKKHEKRVIWLVPTASKKWSIWTSGTLLWHGADLRSQEAYKYENDGEAAVLMWNGRGHNDDGISHIEQKPVLEEKRQHEVDEEDAVEHGRLSYMPPQAYASMYACRKSLMAKQAAIAHKCRIR
jgi:hypothetical protein